MADLPDVNVGGPHAPAHNAERHAINANTAAATAASSAINAHIADTTDAHDATAISFDPAGSFLTATDTQAAITETSSVLPGTLYHGTNGSTARLASTGFMRWIGTVEPLNAISSDEWWSFSASTVVVKIKSTSGWLAIVDSGAVRFDSNQAISNAQKAIALTNAGVMRGTLTADLNAYFGGQYHGTYFVSAASTNKPGTYAGLLTVEYGSGEVTIQRFVETYAFGKSYIRWRDTSNTWGQWHSQNVGDTGWRDITPTTLPSQLDPRSKILVRRIASQVTLHLEAWWTAQATGYTAAFDLGIFSSMSGFGQVSTLRPAIQLSDNGVNSVDSVIIYLSRYARLLWRQNIGGALATTIPASTSARVGELTWFTNDAWPTVLPGTPA